MASRYVVVSREDPGPGELVNGGAGTPAEWAARRLEGVQEVALLETTGPAYLTADEAIKLGAALLMWGAGDYG